MLSNLLNFVKKQSESKLMPLKNDNIVALREEIVDSQQVNTDK